MKCEYCDQRPACNEHPSIEDASFCDSCFEGVLIRFHRVGTIEEALTLQKREQCDHRYWDIENPGCSDDRFLKRKCKSCGVSWTADLDPFYTEDGE